MLTAMRVVPHADEAPIVERVSEARIERFFALGRRIVGSANPIAIFLAGCRECLPEWELQAVRLVPSVDIEQGSGFCPRGQNPEGDAR